MYFKTIRNVFQINFVVLSVLVRTFPPVSRSSIITAKMSLGKIQQMEVQFLRWRLNQPMLTWKFQYPSASPNKVLRLHVMWYWWLLTTPTPSWLAPYGQA